MSTEKIAIVGMEVALGACRDLDAFSRHLYEGTDCSPAGVRDQRDAAARVLAGALTDAQVTPGASVLVLTPEEELFDALEEARRLLSTARAEEVAIVAGDEQDAAALVLRTLRRAQTRHDRIYALLEGHTTIHFKSPPAAKAVEVLYHRTLEEGGVLAEEVGYVEVCESGHGGLEGILEGLSRAHTSSGTEPTCALGSSTNLTSATPLLQMAALVKSALSLHQRFLPARPDRSAFRTEIPNGPFYVDDASRPWFVAGAERRLASLLSVDEEGRCTHLLLSDYPQPRRESRQLQNSACYLLPLGGEEQVLLAALRQLRRRVDESATESELQSVARRCFESYRRRPTTPYTLVIVGQTREALLRDIDFALEGVPKSIRRQKAWSTPRGSYFTPRPLAQEGEVAFVYPGAFNAYPNLGRDLFRLFPRLHERFARIIPDLGKALAERMLYPRSVAPLSRGDWRAHEAALVKQPALLIEAGTSFAILFTALLRDHFGVRPASAFGYSLGEASMLWAAEIWQDVEVGSRAWRESALFTRRLSGRKEAVRARWGVSPEVPDDALWQTYLLKAPIEKIRAALREEPRVTLTMINTLREGIIGGDPAGCRRVINALDCHALPVPYDAVIHADVMRSELPELVELYTHPIAHRPDCTFYSAARSGPLRIESRSLAEALADMTCRQIDFPRLVEQAYASGARLFVELGPQRTCTRWIDEILAGRPHAAMAINKKGTPDVVSIFGVLAQLLSHGVEVDISTLYATGEVASAAPTDEAVDTVPEPGKVAERVPVLAAAGQGGWQDEAQTDAGARSHGAFLEARHTSLQETGASIRTQIDAYTELLESPQQTGRASRRLLPLFDRADLEAFATGSPAHCFGALYAPFEGRRMPRIPNGDLMLISRVVDVEGTTGELRAGSTLVSEYDVPDDAWFYRQNGSPTTPYAVCMEMALQPCGFLSAYLGSALSHAESDLYFRNLDGEGHLHATPDLRGRTVTDRVRLLSTTTVKGTILQRFAFSLACAGETFYEGEAAFGYFERRALLNQQGLDGGQVSRPWYENLSLAGQGMSVLDLQAAESRRRYYTPSPTRPHYRLARDRLDLLDTVRIVERGGRYGRGYVHATMRIDPRDWFFACHFYQDPVMPGSLGLEAMQQALQLYALHEGLGEHLRSPCFVPAPELTTVWKYRGQVTPEDGSLELEVHLRDRDLRPDRVTLVGEGSLWKGERRIYEVTEIGLRLQETDVTKGVV